MKTITVIIPTHNRIDKLRNLLESLDCQTLSKEHFDILVVDDGSTDGTSSFLKEKGIPHISQPNKGPAAARNAGVQKTSTPALLFIDDDAIADKGWLEAAYELILNQTGDFVAEGDVVMTGEDLPMSHSVNHIGPNGCLTCNLLVTRGLLETVGGFNEQFKYPINEDFDFFIRVRKIISIRYLSRMKVYHPVYPLKFCKTLFDSYSFAWHRIESDYLLFNLHPEEFKTVKAVSTAKASIKRLSLQYLRLYGFRNPVQLVLHPAKGIMWLIVCAARQACFITLTIRGYLK